MNYKTASDFLMMEGEQMDCQYKRVYSPLLAQIKMFELAQADQMFKVKRGLVWCDKCGGYHIEIVK